VTTPPPSARALDGAVSASAAVNARASVEGMAWASEARDAMPRSNAAAAARRETRDATPRDARRETRAPTRSSATRRTNA
jgi:hypothetical protein